MVQNRDTIKKIGVIVLLLIFTSLIFFLFIEYYEYSRYNIEKDFSEEVLVYLVALQNNNEKALSFHYNLDESIDAFYIIGPYLISDAKHRIIDQKWYNYETFSDYLFNEMFFSGVDFDESFQQLIFLKANEIVGVAKIQRNQGDFLSLGENKYTVNEKFKNIEKYNNYYIIEKANE